MDQSSKTDVVEHIAAKDPEGWEDESAAGGTSPATRQTSFITQRIGVGQYPL
jgi:hypothetical protein